MLATNGKDCRGVCASAAHCCRPKASTRQPPGWCDNRMHASCATQAQAGVTPLSHAVQVLRDMVRAVRPEIAQVRGCRVGGRGGARG